MAKYEVEKNPRVEFKDDTGWYLTDHAAERWDQRTPHHSVSPESAFKTATGKGTVIKWLDETVYPCDKLLYFRDDEEAGQEYGALFLCKHERISTVLTDDMLCPAARGLCRSVWKICESGYHPYAEGEEK
jgi:hypothetical protein